MGWKLKIKIQIILSLLLNPGNFNKTETLFHYTRMERKKEVIKEKEILCFFLFFSLLVC